MVAEPSNAGDQREDVASFAARLSKVAKGVLGPASVGKGILCSTTGNVSDEMVAQYIETQDAEGQDDDFRVTE